MSGQNGSRYWRMKYRFVGREKLLSLGIYPEVSLAEARRLRDAARTLLRNGTDPMAAKADRKATDRRNADASFAKVAAAWLAFKRKGWATETHRKAEYVVGHLPGPGASSTVDHDHENQGRRRRPAGHSTLPCQ